MKFLRKLLLLCLVTSLSSLSGNSIPWRQKSTFQFAQDVELQDLLRGFSALQGISMVIDPDIKGSVNGRFEDIAPDDFMDRISRAYGLVWFYDGNILHVYPAQKTESKFIEINDLAAVKLLETISNLGMVAPTSSIRILGTGGIAFVSGPPRYVEIVSDIATRLSKNLRINYSTAPKIKIFPLKYAWAYDTTFNTQESTVTIPGVATVLRGLMDTGTNVSPEVIVSGQRTINKFQAAPRAQTFMDRSPERYNYDLKNNSEDNSKDNKKNAKDDKKNNDKSLKENPVAVGATLIQPDVRLNAIIVRDVEEKMSQYEEVIKALDVPLQIIEIAVTIVDVTANASRDIGNKFFSYTPTGHPDRQFNLAPSGISSTGTAVNQASLTLNSVANISGKTVVNGAQFLSHVQALAETGNSNVLSRPSVVTLNNIEAEIAQTSSIYVPVQGKDAADLANVSASTKLKVTPRVIENPDEHLNKIKLLVSIDNGTLDVTLPSNPQTKNASIQTQAVIREGQSLLIGGFYDQTEGESEKGVPFLKDIPLLGYLFKTKGKTSATTERLFLITPRIIDLSYETGPDIEEHLANFKKPTHGIAGKASARNFRIRHQHKIHGGEIPDLKDHSPYSFGYNPHPRNPHYFKTFRQDADDVVAQNNDSDCCYVEEDPCH